MCAKVNTAAPWRHRDSLEHNAEPDDECDITQLKATIEQYESNVLIIDI